MSFPHTNEGFFVYRGVNSRSMRVTIERYPQITKPRKRLNFYNVPGRMGDVVTWDGGYDNINISYKVWFTPGWRTGGIRETLAEAATRINDWLSGIGNLEDGAGNAYGILYDNYCLEERVANTEYPYLREAVFVGPLIIESTYNEIGSATITFSCKPQLYGENEFMARNIGMNQSNPSAQQSYTFIGNSGYVAKPLITLYRSGIVDFKYTTDEEWKSIRLYISDEGWPVCIDCEDETYYHVDDEGNKIAYGAGDQSVSAGFPVIPEPGVDGNEPPARMLIIRFRNTGSETTTPDQATIIPRRFVL